MAKPFIEFTKFIYSSIDFSTICIFVSIGLVIAGVLYWFKHSILATLLVLFLLFEIYVYWTGKINS